MRRQTKYYARFYGEGRNIIEAFMVEAHNPKQAMNSALAAFGETLAGVKQVLISRADDADTTLVAWNATLT